MALKPPARVTVEPAQGKLVRILQQKTSSSDALCSGKDVRREGRPWFLRWGASGSPVPETHTCRGLSRSDCALELPDKL